MAQIANITVKNRLGADVVYAASQGSAGDKNPAIWRQDAAGTNYASRPEFRVTVRSNASNTTRVTDGAFKFPVVDGVTGLITDVLRGTFSFTEVNRVAETTNEDAVTQFSNLFASALVRAICKTGTNAT